MPLRYDSLTLSLKKFEDIDTMLLVGSYWIFKGSWDAILREMQGKKSKLYWLGQWVNSRRLSQKKDNPHEVEGDQEVEAEEEAKEEEDLSLLMSQSKMGKRSHLINLRWDTTIVKDLVIL